MVGHVIGSKLGRTHSGKRRRTDTDHDIDDSLKKLRLLTNRLRGSPIDQSFDFKSLVDLLQIQTMVIEALASHHYNITPKQHTAIDRTRHQKPQPSSTRTSKIDKKWKTLEDIAEASTSQPSIEDPLATDPLVTGPDRAVFEQSPKTSTKCAIQLLTPPHTPERQQHKPRESFEVPLKISSSLLPPTPPPKDHHKDDLRSNGSRLSTNTESNPLSYNHSPRLSSNTLNSTRSPRPCTTCSTKQWILQNQTDPCNTDFARESDVQQAATRLITNTKIGVRTSIGPLNDGVFNLYSSEYRKHYCVHDRPDRQSLLVYSESSTWAAEFPGVPPPSTGEIAMELLVYPDCLLIVKPFRVPKYAGWKWCALDAMGDHAKPTTVEVMFLGEGYLKLKVKLSELLGGGG